MSNHNNDDTNSPSNPDPDSAEAFEFPPVSGPYVQPPRAPFDPNPLDPIPTGGSRTSRAKLVAAVAVVIATAGLSGVVIGNSIGSGRTSPTANERLPPATTPAPVTTPTTDATPDTDPAPTTDPTPATTTATTSAPTTPDTGPAGEGDTGSPSASDDAESTAGDDADQDAVATDDDGYIDLSKLEPFEGMTEDQIGELSDEDFLNRLEHAGIDIQEPVPTPPTGGNPGHDGEPDQTAPHDPVLGSFKVDGDKIDLSTASSETADKATAIWNRFTTLIPADQRQMVVKFEVLAGEGIGGYVHPADEDPNKWVLGISPTLGERLDYVLIHEFAHLLTLNAEEVPPNYDDTGCTTFHTGEGCVLKGSTIGKFVAKFWPKSLQDELAQAQASESGVDGFYGKHQDEFVSGYASSSPAEDLAETFAVFVTEDRPTLDTVAAQKIQMLWDDAELVALRDQIRTNLGAAETSAS